MSKRRSRAMSRSFNPARTSYKSGADKVGRATIVVGALKRSGGFPSLVVYVHCFGRPLREFRKFCERFAIATEPLDGPDAFECWGGEDDLERLKSRPFVKSFHPPLFTPADCRAGGSMPKA